MNCHLKQNHSHSLLCLLAIMLFCLACTPSKPSPQSRLLGDSGSGARTPSPSPVPSTGPVSEEEPPRLNFEIPGVRARMGLNGESRLTLKSGQRVELSWETVGLKEVQIFVSSTVLAGGSPELCPAAIAVGVQRQTLAVTAPLKGSQVMLLHRCQANRKFRATLEGIPMDSQLPTNHKVRWVLAEVVWEVSLDSVTPWDLTQIRILSGQGLMTNQGQQLPQDMVVEVFDSLGRVAKEESVEWEVVDNPLTGWLWPLSDSETPIRSRSTTDSLGRARMNYVVSYINENIGLVPLEIRAGLSGQPRSQLSFRHLLHPKVDFAGRTQPSLTWLSEDPENRVFEIRANQVRTDYIQLLFTSSHSITGGRRLPNVGLTVTALVPEGQDGWDLPRVFCEEETALSDSLGIAKCSLRAGSRLGDVILDIQIGGFVHFTNMRVRVVP